MIIEELKKVKDINDIKYKNGNFNFAYRVSAIIYIVEEKSN